MVKDSKLIIQILSNPDDFSANLLLVSLIICKFIGVIETVYVQ